jgi:hypothetical protein
MAASVGWKVKDAIVGFHGIGRLVRTVNCSGVLGPMHEQRLSEDNLSERGGFGQNKQETLCWSSNQSRRIRYRISGESGFTR